MSTTHVCAIRKTTDATNDTVRCWGANTGEGKALAVPSNLGTVSAVSAGKDYVCAIRKTTDTNTNNTVRCWGANTGEGKALAVPSNLGTVSAVSTGKDYVCAIRKTTDATNDTVRCWGANTGQDEALEVSSNLGTVKEVAAGLYVSHICIVKSNDEVFCWGDNINKSQNPELVTTMPAELQGSGVTIGLHHICAMKQSDSKPSKPVCWGFDNSKQVSGPNPNSPPWSS